MLQLKDVPNYKYLSANKPNFQAILWDLDGTIINSESLHTQATIDTIKELSSDNIPSEDMIAQFCYGLTDQMIYDHLQNSHLLQHTSAEKFIEYKNQKIKYLLDHISLDEIFNSNILSLMEQCYQKGIKQAVVTSSERIVAQLILGHLKLHSYFEFVIGREDTIKNKPNAMPYQSAIKRLKIPDQNIIIFEDSPAGLAAAQGTNATIYQAMWY